MRDFLSADIEDHVAVLRRRPAVPSLEQVAHHHADFAPLSAKDLLELLRVDRVRSFGSRVILVLIGSKEHHVLLGGDRSARPRENGRRSPMFRLSGVRYRPGRVGPFRYIGMVSWML